MIREISGFEAFMLLGAFGGALFAASAGYDRIAGRKWYRGPIIWLFCIEAIAAVGLSYATPPSKLEIEQYTIGMIILGAGMCVAVALWWLRRTRQDLYGLIELGTAFVVLGLLAVPAQGGGLVAHCMAFLGGVFLAKEGVANMFEGWEKLRSLKAP